MKKLKYLLILFLMFTFINNIEAFNTSLKVYDYAQILTTEEERELKKSIDLYIANHNMDMAIVTVKYHDKVDTMNYADDFYDYNGFGIGSNYDGVIFVLDFTFWENGDIWMSTEGRAIDVYTDVRIDSILDSVVAKKNRGYYEMFNAFIEKTNYYADEGVPIYSNNNSTSSIWIGIIIASFVIPSIVVLILVLKNRMVKLKNTAGDYLLRDTIVVNKRSDRFITTHTTSVRINDSSSSSGGSSTHRSSSGRSHGGGGRRL